MAKKLNQSEIEREYSMVCEYMAQIVYAAADRDRKKFNDARLGLIGHLNVIKDRPKDSLEDADEMFIIGAANYSFNGKGNEKKRRKVARLALKTYLDSRFFEHKYSR